MTEDPDALDHEFDPLLWKRVLAHGGQWVAVADPRDPHSTIIVGEDAADVMKRAARAGFHHPSLVRAPEPGTSLLL